MDEQSADGTQRSDHHVHRREREIAIRQILEVISQSRDDEQPVFDVILENAASICNAPLGYLCMATEDRSAVTCPARRGAFSKFGETLDDLQVPLVESRLALARAINECEIFREDDITDNELYKSGDPDRVSMVEDEGARSLLVVPLVSNGQGVGSITLYRREVMPFSDDDVSLVESFAAQAVIAIENVRQFRELQTRLERDAASGEILRVISRSRDDEGPVFDTILENAMRLCDAEMAVVNTANEALSEVKFAAGINAVAPKYQPGRDSWPIDSEMFVCRAIYENRTFHTADLKDTDLYRSGDPTRRNLVDNEGMLTQLVLPLTRGDSAIASFSLYRRKVQPFSENEIALLETFAAQAVIAIENVRQFRELQTRLEREAATRKVLEVISQSRDDEGPVFDVILEQAAKLCNAPQAGLILANEDRTHVTYTANWGPPSKHFQPGVSEWSIDSPIAISTAIREGRVVNIPDTMDDEAARQSHPDRVEILKEEQIRSILAVPLMKDGVAIGCFDVYRLEVAPFSDDDIALLESFAAQAVIAIENVRQFRELQNRLAREGATRKVLEVISQSRDDETPVFDTILENTARLCETDLATLNLMNEESTHLEYAAHFGRSLHTYDVGIDRWSIDSTLQIAQSVREARVVHNVDLRETDLYKHGDKWRRQLADDEGVRSFLTVPLFSPEGKAVGCIGIYRKEVRAFTNDEISLVETFAAQAVIAIENVRQFKALEARTEEVQALNASLEERVEDQVSEIERMGRMKQFLSPAVADAVVTSGDEAMLKSHRRLIATLFCDIRGFTAFCETAEPEETIEVLQNYHQELGNLISTHGGGVDKRMGDGIMVIFNDPLPCDDPAGDAVRLAISMRLRMIELSKGWKRLGHRLGFGVGVSLGYATIGMVGSEGRYDYTASGTAVNMAARLCDLAEDGEILLSVRARVAVEDDFRSVSAGKVTLKGIREPVEVFKLAEPAEG